MREVLDEIDYKSVLEARPKVITIREQTVNPSKEAIRCKLML